MNLVRRVRELNKRLHEELGAADAYRPFYQWFLCRDLFYLIPEFEEAVDGKVSPVMDYHCACGINKQIHHPHCRGFVVAKERLIRESTALGLPQDHWVIARWLPPTLPVHPRSGYYVPVSVNGYTMAFPPDDPPDLDKTLFFIRAFSNKEKVSLEEMEKDFLRMIDRKEEKEVEAYRLMFKEWLPTFGQIPGEKMETSYPSVSTKVN